MIEEGKNRLQLWVHFTNNSKKGRKLRINFCILKRKAFVLLWNISYIISINIQYCIISHLLLFIFLADFDNYQTFAITDNCFILFLKWISKDSLCCAFCLIYAFNKSLFNNIALLDLHNNINIFLKYQLILPVNIDTGCFQTLTNFIIYL